MNLYPPPETDNKQDLFAWMESIYRYLQEVAVTISTASTTWDAGSIADGDEEAKEVTVSGAELGDFAVASFSVDVSDLCLDAQVTATDTVTCILSNNTGGAIDLGSGTLRVKVIKK